MAILVYTDLIGKLNKFIGKYYKNQLIKGGIYSVGILSLFFITIAIAEFLGHFNSSVRTVLFYAFVSIGLFVLAKYIVLPLAKLYKLGDTLSYEEAAVIIGNHFPSVKDKLLNVLQLQENNGGSLSAEDNALVEASIHQKINALAPVPFSSAVDFSDNKKHLPLLLIPFGIIGLTLLFSPTLIKEGTKRIVKHNQEFEIDAPFQFTILNDDLSALSQEDFQLNVKLSGAEIPDKVYMLIDGNTFTLNKKNVLESSYTFKNLQRDIDFQLTADGFNSKIYHLKVMPNPILLNFDLTLNYPAYLNKKVEVIKNMGDVTVPEGTMISWKFATKNADFIRMVFKDTTITLDATSKSSRYKKRLYIDQNYAVATSNAYAKNHDSVNYAIRVIADKHPQIKVREKADTTSSRYFYFEGAVEDDYGLQKLTFNYRFVSTQDSSLTDDSVYSLVSVPISVKNGALQDRFFHYWDLNEINVSPGDVVEYYFEVWDNDGVRGSKSTKSQKKTVHLPTREQLEKKVEETTEGIKDELAEALKETKDVQEKLSDLQRKMSEKESMSWEEKKKLQGLLNKQSELYKKVEQLGKKNKSNNEQQRQYSKQDEEILSKQKQLEELFNNVMTPELKEKYAEMQKLLEELHKDDIKDALDKLELDNEDMIKELDRNLELFKQLEVEQKLQESIDKLDDLAKKQQALAKKSLDKNQNPEALAEEQKALNKEFEKLKEDLADLEKKNKALERPNDLEDTSKEQSSIEEKMNESSDDLEKKKQKSAAESQQEATDEMNSLQKKLSKMKAAMASESAMENIEDLRAILSNLIELSFSQEALMERLQKTNTDDPRFFEINREQIKLRDGAEVIADSLFALSKRAPEIKSIVNKEIAAINHNMDKAIEELSEAPTIYYGRINHRKEAQSRQQFAMTSINNLALMLSEALDNMQAKAQKSKEPGDGQCKNPGGKGEGKGKNGKKPSAESLRKMQEELNKRIKDLKKGAGASGGKSGMSKQLAQMAAQQEAIRREVQKLAKEMGGEGAGGKEMSKLAREMEKTENDLVNRVISPETIERQEEILSRLLESEKADKERGEDEKRESEESKNDFFGNPKELLEYKKMKKQETELLKTVPPTLNPFFKKRVKSYFSNFEE